MAIYDNDFMSLYSWIISEIFCTALNASLNPLLYVLRMKEMRLWIVGILPKRASNDSEGIENSNNETEIQL